MCYDLTLKRDILIIGIWLIITIDQGCPNQLCINVDQCNFKMRTKHDQIYEITYRALLEVLMTADNLMRHSSDFLNF